MNLIDLATMWTMGKKGKTEIDYFKELLDENLDNRIDSNVLASYLLTTYGDCECRFNTSTMTLYASNVWFKSHAKQISHLLDATEQQYNPLEEFKTTEHKEESSHRDINDESDSTSAEDNNGKSNKLVSADNEPNYQPREEIPVENHVGMVASSTLDRDDDYSGEYDIDRSGHNTSNQELLIKQWESAQLSTIEWIGNEWSCYLCSGVL